MKRQNLFLITLLITISTIAFAQDLTIGVRGGLNYSTISGDPNPSANVNTEKSQSPKIGFTLGIDALHPLNDKMAIQAELFYSREGFKGSESYEGTTDYIQKFSFLNLPIFFKYSLGRHFYVMGGPQFSYLLAAKSEYTIYDRPGHIYRQGTNDVSQTMNKFGLGLTPAVGYDIKKISIGLRYYAELTQLVKSEYDTKIKGQVFSVVVSYKILSIKK